MHYSVRYVCTSSGEADRAQPTPRTPSPPRRARISRAVRAKIDLLAQATYVAFGSHSSTAGASRLGVPRFSTIGRGIYFGHFRLKKLRLHRSAAKKSRQRLWHDDAASARFQPSSGRGRRSRWRAPPRSVGEFVCSWGHHSGRHALALLRCDGSAATKTSRRCEPSRRAHPPPALRHARKGPRDPQSVSPPDFSAR